MSLFELSSTMLREAKLRSLLAVDMNLEGPKKGKTWRKKLSILAYLHQILFFKVSSYGCWMQIPDTYSKQAVGGI